MKNRGLLVALVTALLAAGSAGAQDLPGPLDGMWSDPPLDPVDFFCAAVCTQAGIDRLNELLDDPANDDRSYEELTAEADRASNAYVRALFTPEALANRIDDLHDPGYLNCEPWGLSRQLLARHQLEIHTYADRVEMHYGEWDAHRTVHLGESATAPDVAPSRLGYSVGHYEGDTLVIETTGIRANIHRNGIPHSDELHIVERYARDGERLLLTAIYEDPFSLQGPIELKKVWEFRPDLKIAPYVDCEKPTQASE